MNDDLGLPEGWSVAPAQDDNLGLPAGWSKALPPPAAMPANPPMPPSADLTALRAPNPGPVPAARPSATDLAALGGTPPENAPPVPAVPAPAPQGEAPGMLSTFLQAGGKGIAQAATDVSRAASPFTDRPAEQSKPDAVDGYLKQSLVDGGWKDPNVWAAKIAHGIAGSSPMLFGAMAGAGLGSTVGPEGTLAGGMGGAALGTAIQTIAPAYLEARQSGLDHDAAVNFAIDKTGINSTFATIMGAVPLVGKAGQAVIDGVKPAISRTLAELFVVQPGLMAGQQVANNAHEGKPLGQGVADAALEGAAVGGAMHGWHASQNIDPSVLAGKEPKKPESPNEAFLREHAAQMAAEAGKPPPGPQSYDYTMKDGTTRTATPTDPEVQQELRDAEARRQAQEAQRAPQRAAEEAARKEAEAKAAAAKTAQEQADAARAAKPGQQPPPDAEAPAAAPNPEPAPTAPGGAGAAAQPGEDSHGILRQAGYSDEDIAKMSPEEQAAEVEEARQNGIVPEPKPAAGTRAAPVKAETAADVDTAAAHVNTAPTEGQKAANNYAHGHVVVGGLPISIENPKGSVRSGTDTDGTPWQTTLPAHYGYIRGSEGADGDHVDAYIGPNPASQKAFVVDQIDPKTGKFDEHKIVLGTDDAHEAANLYAGGFSDGSGPARMGAITETTPQAIKDWIAGGKVGTPWATPAKVEGLPEGWRPTNAPAPSSEIEGHTDSVALGNGGQPAPATEQAPESLKPISGKSPSGNGRATKPAAPQPLIRFLRNAGGLKDEGGELKALDLYRHPGLVNNKAGMSLDQARRAAAEAGYLGGDTDHAMANTTVADFLGALGQHPRYSVHDEQAVAEHNARKAARSDDIDRATGEHTRTIRATLADHGIPETSIDPVAVSLGAELMHHEGLDPLTAYEEASWRMILADREAKENLEKAQPEIPFDDVAATPAHLVPDEPWNDQPVSAGAVQSGHSDRGDREEHPRPDAARPQDDGHAEEGAADAQRPAPAHAAEDQEGAGSPGEVTPKGVDPWHPVNDLGGNLSAVHSGGMVTNPKMLAFLKDWGLAIGKPAAWNSGQGLKLTENGARVYKEWGGYGQPYGPEMAEYAGYWQAQRNGAPAPTAEKTEAGQQTVIPGAEQIGQGEQAQRAADKPLKPKVPQKDVGGLFGDDSKQTDLLDLAKKPKTPSEAIRDGELPVEDARETQRKENVRNLEEQETEIARVVDAPEFKRWFKGSKVVDADGAPLRMYHGTNVWESKGRQLGDFEEFDRLASVKIVGRPEGMDTVGNWFTDNPEAASKYAGDNGAIYPVFLDITNPWRPATFDAFMDKIFEARGEKRPKRGGPSGSTEPLRAWLKSQGFDGIAFPFNEADRFDHHAWVALEPYQVRSAITGKVMGKQPTEAEQAATEYEKAEEEARRAIAGISAEPKPREHVVAYKDGTPKESLPSEKLANRLLKGPMTLKEAADIVGKLDKKELEEHVESGVVLAARQIAEDYGADKAGAFKRIVQLYDNQPKLGTRTSTSIRDQAYSTPAPLAFAAASLADIGPKTRVYEPSAGNGMLLITANPALAVANEINPARAKAIGETIGAHPMSQDASEPGTTRFAEAVGFPGKSKLEGSGRRVPFDRIIANPPFGAVRVKGNETRTFDMSKYGKGYETAEIDHAIALNALDGMKDDGKAVLILGGPSPLAKTAEERGKAYTGKAKRNFYAALYGAYNVVDHFTVSGDLYEKQGAGWPVDVIVIQGRGRSALPLPRNAVPPLLSTWEEVGGKLNGLDYSSASSEPAGAPVAEPAGGRAPGPDGGHLPVDGGRASGHMDQPGPVAEPANVREGGDSAQRPTRPDAGERPAGDDRGQSERPDAAHPADEPVEPVKRKPIQQDAETETQVPYEPAAKTARGLGTLVPANQRTAVANALKKLDKEVGGVDNFVAKELGMPLKAVGEAFSAEQVDAIALGIKNIEKGAALVVGDQTGVGKGRIVAGLIMYAMRKGMTPVFVTEKPNLYADIYRDLVDIKAATHLGREPSLLMTNSGTNDKVPLDEEGTKILAPMRNHNAELAAIARGDKTLTHDIVLTTYNQMQTVKGQEGVRRDFLRAIAPNALMLFDEAHNAGSLKEKRPPKKGAPPPPPDRADFTRELVQLAKGVYYSSATYAKRPDSMDFYSRTDMRLAVDDLKKLAEAIELGGVPLQTVNSAMLAEAGQYLRRERTFDGIKYGVDLVPTDRTGYKDFAGSLRAVQTFSKVVEEATKKLDLDGTDIVGHDASTGEAGAQSTNFTSVMHNLIGQYLLAVKADEAASRAVAAIKAGQRPVIALANTNESFLADYMKETGAKIGDKVELDFRSLLHRYLERSREVLIKKGFAGEGERKRLTDAELGPIGVALFKAARKTIDAGSYGTLPVSPMDRMRQVIKDAGYTVGEITGRSRIIDYGPQGAFLAARPGAETSIAGRRASIRDFNSGKLNALIINAAGSTGLSLHDDPRFPKSGAGQRHMIIAQANGDINTHMQTLGRVNRTGQQTKPQFTQLGAQLAAEMRPMAILAKKMASLNANTTSAKGSALTAKDVPDFMNKYGDAVATQLLYDEPEINRILDYPGGDDPSKPKEDTMRKVTGRIALLDPDDQDRIMDLLQDAYQRLIDHYDAIGENALEAKTLDLDAKLLSEHEFVPSRGTSPFEQAANVGTYDVKSTAKPVSFDDTLDKLAEATGAENLPADPVAKLTALTAHGEKVMDERLKSQLAAFEAFKKEVLTPLKKKADDPALDTVEADAARAKHDMEKTRFDGIRDQLKNLAGTLHPGAKVTLTEPETGEKWTGVVIDTTRSGKTKNPLALSSWSTQIAVPGFGVMNMPLTKLRTASSPAAEGKMEVEHVPSWIQSDKQTKETFDALMGERREKRLIITGNLLAGFAKAKGRRTIVHFTDHEGKTRQGIMLGATASVESLMAGSAKPLPTAGAVIDHVTQAEGTSATSTDGYIRVVYQKPSRQRWASPEVSIQIKAKKAEGGRYFLDPGVLDVANFRKEGQSMVYGAGPVKAQEVVGALMKAGAKFERPLTEAEQKSATTAKAAGGVKHASFGEAGDKPALYHDIESVLRLMGGKHFKGATVSAEPPPWVMSQEAVRRSGGDGSELPFGAMNPETGEIWIREGSGAEVLAAVHEIKHVLDEAGTIKATERRLLDAETPRLREMVARRFGATAEQMEGMTNDEVQTYAAQIAYQDKQALIGQHIGVRRILERAANTLTRLKNAMLGRGFQTLDDFFNRIHSGEVGRREAGEVRPAREKIEPRMSMFGQTTTGPTSRFADAYTDKPFFPRMVAKAKKAIDDSHFVENWQDWNQPVLRMQNDVANRLGNATLPDHLNPYLTKRLIPGRLKNLQAKAFDRFERPMRDIARGAKLTMQDLGLYALAKHAPERNALMDQRDPSNNGTGSSISDQEARDIEDGLRRAGKWGALENVGKIAAQMREFTLDTMVSSGLMAKATADELRQQYQHYYPLSGWEDEAFAPDDAYFHESKKLGPRGKEFQTAFGRKTLPEHPLMGLIHQMYRAIDRSERNRAAKVVYRLLKALPKPDRNDIALIDEGKPKKMLDKATGLMVWGEERQRPDPHVMTVKLGGVTHYVTFKDKRVGEAVNRMTGVLMPTPFRQVLHLWSGIKAAWTHLVVDFLAGHFLSRYVIELAGNQAEHGFKRGIKAAAAAFPGLGPASRAAFRAERLKPADVVALRQRIAAGTASSSDKWNHFYLELKEAGGLMNFTAMTDLDRIKHNFADEIAQFGQQPLRATRAKVTHAFEAWDHVTNALDAAERLSVYRQAREAGKSVAQAALDARDSTVDFNLRGKLSPVLGIMRAFGNVAVQTTAGALKRFARNPKQMSKVAGAFMLAGSALTLWNYGVGGIGKNGKPDIENIPSYTREKNIVMLIPGIHDKDGMPYAAKLPMAYFWNLPYQVGSAAATLSMKAGGLAKTDIGEVAGGVMHAALEALTPLGNEAGWLAKVMPEALLPATHVATNTNWFGAPVHNPNPREGLAHANQGRLSTSEFWKSTAKGVNRLTGGDDYHSGKVDMFPEDYREMLGFVTASWTRAAGRVGDAADSVMKGELPSPTDIPVLQTFVTGGKQSAAYVQAQYREEKREAGAAASALKKAISNGDREAAERIRAEEGDRIRAHEVFKATDKVVRQLYAQRDRLDKDKTLTAAARAARQKEIDQKIVTVMEQAQRRTKPH